MNAPSKHSSPRTPDFDSWPCEKTISAFEFTPDILTLTWSDGVISRYHACWLADNDPGPALTNPLTREREVDLDHLPADIAIKEVSLDEDSLHVAWTSGPDRSSFLPGWLRANDYSNDRTQDNDIPARVTWNIHEIPEPPTTDGADVLDNDDTLGAWLEDLQTYGLARLANVPTEDGMVAKVARRIGPVRESNFGFTYDVMIKSDPDSNAYTTLALDSHTDLATREYQPGLQFLHCLKNSTEGGQGTMVDGFRVAEDIRKNRPDYFQILSTWNWTFTNRAVDTDYRWNTPLFVLDKEGELSELRMTTFLRGPLALPFDQVEKAYEAYRFLIGEIKKDRYRMVFDYRPGDLVAYDNRRILHGRESFAGSVGERWLQGCYSEREELHSRLRILARHRRAALV